MKCAFSLRPCFVNLAPKLHMSVHDEFCVTCAHGASLRFEAQEEPVWIQVSTKVYLLTLDLSNNTRA